MLPKPKPYACSASQFVCQMYRIRKAQQLLNMCQPLYVSANMCQPMCVSLSVVTTGKLNALVIAMFASCPSDAGVGL